MTALLLSSGCRRREAFRGQNVGVPDHEVGSSAQAIDDFKRHRPLTRPVGLRVEADDLRAKCPSTQWNRQQPVLLILNRKFDRPDYSSRKLQTPFLNQRAASIEHSDDEVPRGVVGISDRVRVSHRVDVDKGALRA